MASNFIVATPSPPGTVHTPNTPRFGYSDSWEPFSPRKSARISLQQQQQQKQQKHQQSINRTPSPRFSNQSTLTATKSSTTFSTPATSPQKKRMPTMDSVRRAPSALKLKSTADSADASGINPKVEKKTQSNMAATSQNTGMLPTPSKTPRKVPDARTEAVSRSIARNLFSTTADTTATPKKKSKKYTGLTLDSFRAEEVQEDIEIFTDSRDRVPEVDVNADNPFYGDHVIPDVSNRRSKRKQIAIPGEGKQTVEDAVRRDDGVLVVFRGKKIFRKFSDSFDDDNDPLEGEESADMEDLGEAHPRRVTRSSIKPRLLFQTKDKGKEAAAIAQAEEEEAVTDIEDHVFADAEEVEVPETPMIVADERAKTPDAPRFGPASPPSTTRATRSTDKLNTPVSKPSKVPSPFDGWRRSKSRAAPTGQKRGGDFLAKSPAGTKRQRA